MAVWLQFDSGSRSDAYIFKSTVVNPPNPCTDGNWFPNDFRYSTQDTQTPVNYKVQYKELNNHINKQTLSFLAHCREKPENITYNVAFCALTLPACARVRIPADPVRQTPETIVSILDEPFLYVTIADNDNKEGDLITTNNKYGADQATFVVYNDRLQIGTDQNNAAGKPPGLPTSCSDISANTYTCAVPNIIPTDEIYGYTKYRWAIYKTCMTTAMRLNLGAQQWNIRIYDRFGNDVIVLEDDNDCLGYPRNFAVDPCVPNPPPPCHHPPCPAVPVTYKQPAVPPKPDPRIQTMILVGIKPNFDINSTDYNYGYLGK
jgi:hypothetical protein